MKSKKSLEVRFIKTHDDAVLPERAHQHIGTGDACYDLMAVEDTVIPARGSAVVPVGLKLAHITPGYWLRIEARSGNGFKKGLEPHPGVIDNGYRGDLGIKLFNLTDTDQEIKAGNGVAQFSIQRMIIADAISWTTEEAVEKTARGESGFGSTNKN